MTKEEVITKKINGILNEAVWDIIKTDHLRIYQVILDNEMIRFEFKRPSISIDSYIEAARLQMLAYNNRVNIPKVLYIDSGIKISQWIEGAKMNHVRSDSEPNIQLGKLIGKLNSIQDGDRYLALVDLNNKNSIWTGKDLYFIDLCGLVAIDYEEAIRYAAVGVGMRMNERRWQWFIEGYLYYHPNLDVDYFIKMCEEGRDHKIKKNIKKAGRKIMNKKYILQKIEELRPWYQSIDLNGIKTTDKKKSGTKLWTDIKSVLPKSLTGKRVLDLGSSAGSYSIQSALLGAEVVGVELSNLAYSQALFVKEYFESVYGNLNIKYIQENIVDLDFDKLGHFDYVFALAILYHLDTYKHNKNAVKTFENRNRVIKKLTEMSDNIIVRTRGSKRNRYNKVFAELDFEPETISRDGSRTLIIYRKKGDA